MRRGDLLRAIRSGYLELPNSFLKVREHLSQPLSPRDGRRPPEKLSRDSNIRPPDPGVVLRERAIDNSAFASWDSQVFKVQIAHRHFLEASQSDDERNV